MFYTFCYLWGNSQIVLGGIQMKKVFALILVLAVCLSLMAGCGNNSSTPGTSSSPPSGSPGTNAPGSSDPNTPANSSNPSVPLPSKTINIALQVPANVGDDPLRFPQSSIGPRSYGEMVYEPLLMSDGFGAIHPWLAESYEYNDAATEWIFKIRKDVTFSNGEVMNADDVVLSYNRLVERYTGRDAAYIQSLAPDNLIIGAEKIDDYTVKINMSYTYGGTILAFTDVMIIPDELYAEKGDDLFINQETGSFIGTGPWVIQEHIGNQKATFAKNTNYWNKSYNSYYDEVVFRFITEQTTAIAACTSGDIQAWTPSGGIRNDLLPQLDSVKDKFDVYATPQKSYFYGQFNTAEGKPFNDQKVREAWFMAIDFESIVEYVFGGGTVMTQFVPEGFEGFDPSISPYEFNPEKAKQLLAESSYDGSEVAFYAGHSTLFGEDQLLAIGDYVSAVGFNVKPQVIENSTLNEVRTAGDYDSFVAVGNLNDASPLVYLTLRIRDDAHSHNFYDEQLMTDIDKGAKSVDPVTRADYFSKAYGRMRELSGPLYGLYYATHHAAVGYGIHGVRLDIGGQQYFQFIDFDPDNPNTDHGVRWDVLLNY